MLIKLFLLVENYFSQNMINMEQKKFIQKRFKELIRENNNQFSYNTIFDEDEIIITAFDGDKKIGYLTMDLLFDAYEYEFEDVIDEDSFYNLYPDSEIIKLSHLTVDDNYLNTGVGTQLVKNGINLMKNKGYKQFYLNASPMGFNGLRLPDLVNFYKKFGFKELLNQGNNVLMGMVF